MDGYWEWIKLGVEDSPNINLKANEKVKASTEKKQKFQEVAQKTKNNLDKVLKQLSILKS